MNNSTIWVIETQFDDNWHLYSLHVTMDGAAKETMEYLDIKRDYDPEVDWVGKIITVDKTQAIRQWDDKNERVNSIRFYERTLNP